MSEENNNDDKEEESEEELFERVEEQQAEIEEQCEKLVTLIKNFEGSKSDAALHCCFDIVIWGGESHFESLGIITELGHAYRKASVDAMHDVEDEETEEEHVCDDCREEQEKHKKLSIN